ncbi:hypothetical protein MKY25_17000 [Geobacillus sp. FSL W8-0032]|uniref:hypothetical protein n=1 Tax=Geobacillus TaxID=129337 RepID=UPI0005027540|nr:MULTISPECIES: hypothetical protein [Geobacillus]
MAAIESPMNTAGKRLLLLRDVQRDRLFMLKVHSVSIDAFRKNAARTQDFHPRVEGKSRCPWIFSVKGRRSFCFIEKEKLFLISMGESNQ